MPLPFFSARRSLEDDLRRLDRHVARHYPRALRAKKHNARRRGTGAPRSVVHISPQYFDEKSYIGGGERYATSLARAMADHVETTLVSFGPTRERFTMGRLRVEIYPFVRTLGAGWDPLCYRFLAEIARADVVHCHQYQIAVTGLAILQSALANRRVFVTDLGGAGRHFLQKYDFAPLIDGFLPISHFAETMQARLPGAGGVPSRIIYGGVEPRFLNTADAGPRQTALFVGRLLPHKGINYLVEGVAPSTPLEIIGRPYMPEYAALLRSLATRKQVTFRTDASDETLASSYRRALVTVLPSVYEDVYGGHQAMPELLGLVLLEGMASGTAAVCTQVASLPELVRHEIDGFVVPPNDSAALGRRVDYLVANPTVAVRMGEAARKRVGRDWTWDATALRCLHAYER